MSRKKNNYINTFIEEQNMQYTPWEYTSKGRPAPFMEAKGNKKLYAIIHFFGFGILLAMNAFILIATGGDSIELWIFMLVFMLPIMALMFSIGWRSLKKHKAEKEEAIKRSKMNKKKKRK